MKQERGGATAAALDAIAAAGRRRKRKKVRRAAGRAGGGSPSSAARCTRAKGRRHLGVGPRAKERGIGGSESAVISVSKEL